MASYFSICGRVGGEGFGSSKDSLAFSEIASRILADLFLGRNNPDEKIFRV
jgi:hypothetical protein